MRSSMSIYQGEGPSQENIFSNKCKHQQPLLQSNYFGTTDSFSEQLGFQKSHFLTALFFRKKLLFQNESSTKQLILGVREFFWAVASSKQYFFCGGDTFKTATFHKKIIFQKRNILYHLLFLESHFFRAAIFSKDPTFHSSFFTLELFFRNLLFKKMFYFTATFPIYQLVNSFQTALLKIIPVIIWRQVPNAFKENKLFKWIILVA